MSAAPVVERAAEMLRDSILEITFLTNYEACALLKCSETTYSVLRNRHFGGAGKLTHADILKAKREGWIK